MDSTLQSYHVLCMFRTAMCADSAAWLCFEYWTVLAVSHGIIVVWIF